MSSLTAITRSGVMLNRSSTKWMSWIRYLRTHSSISSTTFSGLRARYLAGTLQKTQR